MLAVFITNERIQNRKLNLNETSISLLIEDKNTLLERLDKLEYSVVDKTQLKEEKEEFERRLDAQYNSIDNVRERLYDLDEKLGSRIPNWNKK